MGTPGPWKWLNYPDGRRLLTGLNNAVIHCPDAPIKVSHDDAAVIASAPDYALLLAAFASGKVELNYTANAQITKALDIIPTGAVFEFSVDRFGCPVLTHEMREELLKLATHSE